jgi:hypothetical protein
LARLSDTLSNPGALNGAEICFSGSRGVESVKVGDPDCDGVRGIRWRSLAHSEQHPDHEGDLSLVRSPKAHNRLLDAPGRILVNWQTKPCRSQYHRPTGRTEGDGRLIALNINNALNRQGLRFVFPDDVSEYIEKRKEAAGSLRFRAVSNDSKSRARKLLLLSGKHSVTGRSQRRVNGYDRFEGHWRAFH